MKGKVLIAFIALLFTASSHSAVYKCTVDGKQIYSDTPCADPDQRESGRLDDKLGFSSGTSRSPVTNNQIRSRSEPIDFGASSQSKFLKAKAIIESLEVDGRDCEWALKVDKRQMDKCVTFLSQMVDGAEWSQATTAIQEILQDDVSFYEEHKPQFSALQRAAERVAGYSQFAQTRLNR